MSVSKEMITVQRHVEEGESILVLQYADAKHPHNWGLVIRGAGERLVDDAVAEIFAEGWEQCWSKFPQAYFSAVDNSHLAGGEIKGVSLRGTLYRRYPQGSGYMPAHAADLAARILADLERLPIQELPGLHHS